MGKHSTKIKRGARALPAPKPEFEVTRERLIHAANDTAVVPATIDKAGERALLTRKFTDSHVDRMHRSKRLTDAQWGAAVWYRQQYEQARIDARVTANYSPAAGGEARCVGTKLLGNERQYAARKLWRQARGLIPAQMLVLVENLVLHDLAPALHDSRARDRHGAKVGRALDDMAAWLNLVR